MITIELRRLTYGPTGSYTELRGQGTATAFELCGQSVARLFPELKNQEEMTLEVSHTPLKDGYPFFIENWLDQSFGSVEYRVTVGTDYDWTRRLLLDETAKYLTRRGYSDGYFRFTYGEYEED